MLFFTSCASCDEPGQELCRRCRFTLASIPSVHTSAGVLAAFEFSGAARQLVLSMKYRNRRRIADALALQMTKRLRLPEVDVVTWAPTSSRRAGERGFDQAELLARAVARHLGVPCRRLLYRTHGDAQTGRSRVQRLHGPTFRGRAPRPGLRVLLVDDVVTTGATLHSAADALRAAGIATVHCVAAAATPAAGRVGRPSGTPAAVPALVPALRRAG
jgi:ComF family protein